MSLRAPDLNGWLALSLLAVVAVAAPASAEPYFAVREGLRCSACHTNMNGGGARTDLVNIHANELLHIPKMFGPLSRPTQYFNGDINEYIGLGANVRANYRAIFQDKPNSQGQVDNNEAFRGRLERNDLDTAAYMYAEVKLIPDYLTFYVDSDLINTDAREAFGLLTGVLPWNGFIKAGRMFLPYGLQLQDDNAFIRQDTFNFNTRETAFELGVEPGPFTWLIAVSNGAGGDRDVRLTSTAYTLFTDIPVVRNVMTGTSFSRVGSSTGDRVMYGFFAGTNVERLTLLAEVDFRRDSLDNGQGHKGHFASYTEADYLFFDWLNFKIAIDFADNDRVGSTLLDDSKNRVSFGVEPFLSRYLQLRLFYRVSNGVQSNPDRNQNELLAEAHMFF